MEGRGEPKQAATGGGTVITQNRRHYLKTRQDVEFQFFGSPTVLHATGEKTDGRFSALETS